MFLTIRPPFAVLGSWVGGPWGFPPKGLDEMLIQFSPVNTAVVIRDRVSRFGSRTTRDAIHFPARQPWDKRPLEVFVFQIHMRSVRKKREW